METTFDLNRAITYIEQNGSILEKARLAYILEGAQPGPAVIDPLLRLQNRDGGLPSRPRPGNISAVDNTLTALWQLDELGLLDSEPASRALDFLRTMQREDGSWDENPALPSYDLPPWIQPGEESTILYLSAYCAYWVAQFSREDDPAVQKAAAFLSSQQNAAGKLPGYLHTTWLGTAALLMAGPDHREAAERGLGYLASLPFAEWDDAQISWALDVFGHAGLPGDHPFIQSGLAELRARQQPDGSWGSEDGPAFAASATAGVIKVFQHYKG